jgi:putative ABC transport system permease protein
VIGELFREALVAIGANRLRSGLTVLGMVIGVAAVIVMLAIGNGVERSVRQSIATMGSNLLVVQSGSTTTGGMRLGSGAAPTLTLDDAQAIAEQPGVVAMAPSAQGTAQLVYARQNWSTLVTGTTPSYFDLNAWAIESGAPFDAADVRGATRVALVGATVAENLFGDEDPVGKSLRINQSPFLVVGVLARRGQSLGGRDRDDTVVVPVTTAQKQVFGAQFHGTVHHITVKVASPEEMDSVQASLEALLRERHQIRADDADPDFTVRNLTAVAATAAETTRVMALLLGAIASISLLVGGIGIMNIMLVSVTERTREIGIRMAIGANPRAILWQFLLESLILSLIGCCVGVLLGVLVAYLVTRLTATPAVVVWNSIALAFSVAAVIGVFFGFYPARQASRLQPIDALRYQ